MKIRIDGIATVWLQKRGLPTKRGSTAEEYKAKVEAYLLAHPDEWPYYNREGRANPFIPDGEHEAPKAQLPVPTVPEQEYTTKHWDEERLENEQKPKEDLPSVEGKKIRYVISRYTQLGIREYLKTYAYADQKENDKWSDNPAWADSFLNPNMAKKVAKRILGHGNFTIEPLDEQK